MKSSQENIQEGLTFVNLVNEIYILNQSDKQILHDEDQSIEQLYQTKKQVREAKIQHLRQAKNKL